MFICIIVTAATLFSEESKLCSMNDMKTAYDGDGEYYLDGWTYEDDYRGIMAFWILSMPSFVMGLCLSIKEAHPLEDCQRIKKRRGDTEMRHRPRRVIEGENNYV